MKEPEDCFIRQSEKYGYLTSSIMVVKDKNDNITALLFVDIYYGSLKIVYEIEGRT